MVFVPILVLRERVADHRAVEKNPRAEEHNQTNHYECSVQVAALSEKNRIVRDDVFIHPLVQVREAEDQNDRRSGRNRHVRRHRFREASNYDRPAGIRRVRDRRDEHSADAQAQEVEPARQE